MTTGSPFGFSGLPSPTLRRSVVDPVTGAPVITAAPTGEVVQRSSILPIGRDDSGSLVPAVPGLVTSAIEAAQYPGQVYRGEKSVFDPSTGHVSEEAVGKGFDLAGSAMVGSSPFSAPKGALRSFGGAAAKDDLPRAPSLSPEPMRLDPSAKSWDLYHGSNAGPDFARFDPHRQAHSESGSLFFAPRAETANDYTTTGRAAAGEAGPRVFRATVEPGKTGVFDLYDLVADDPSFSARASRVIAKEFEDRGLPFNKALRDEQREGFRQGFLAERARDAEINAQLGEMGFAPSMRTGVGSAHGYIGAAIDLAREQGLDTAIIRGLAEHGGDDQVVALTPGRVRSHYAPDQLLYSGGPGGAAAGALASPDQAQAAPGASSMSAGSLFGFGAMPIPNADPDERRRLLQQAPFDPARPPAFIETADLTGPAGAQIHQPGTHKNVAGLGTPALALNEADTQRLDRETGMLPDAPHPASASGGVPGDVAALFGRQPMGAPQSFTGSSGAILPDQGGGPRAAPLPPMRPSAEELIAPKPAPARIPYSFDGLQVPTAPVAPAVDVAATGSVGTGTPTAPAPPMSTANAAPGMVPAQSAEKPGGDDGFAQVWRRLAESGVGDMMGSIGIGLMSTPGFGAGLAAGLKNHQTVSAQRSVTDLAKARFGLEARKTAKEEAGLNATLEALVAKGVPRADAQAAIAASVAGNREALTNLLNNNFRKEPDAPAGYRLNQDGSASFISGGPQDPATKEAEAAATARGTASGKPTEDYWGSPGQVRYDGRTNQPIAGVPDRDKSMERAGSLRKEIQGLPSYKNYAQALPIYQGMLETADRDSKASDLNLIYGLGKIMDPGSVVREGELQLARDTQGAADKLIGMYNSVMGGARLSKEARRQLLGEAYGRLQSYEGAFSQDRQGYEGIVNRYGMNPDDVLPSFRAAKPYEPPASSGSGKSGGGKPGGNPSARFDELRRSGLSEQRAYQKLIDEGY